MCFQEMMRIMCPNYEDRPSGRRGQPSVRDYCHETIRVEPMPGRGPESCPDARQRNPVTWCDPLTYRYNQENGRREECRDCYYARMDRRRHNDYPLRWRLEYLPQGYSGRGGQSGR